MWICYWFASGSFLHTQVRWKYGSGEQAAVCGRYLLRNDSCSNFLSFFFLIIEGFFFCNEKFFCFPFHLLIFTNLFGTDLKEVVRHIAPSLLRSRTLQFLYDIIHIILIGQRSRIIFFSSKHFLHGTEQVIVGLHYVNIRCWCEPPHSLQ